MGAPLSACLFACSASLYLLSLERKGWGQRGRGEVEGTRGQSCRVGGAGAGTSLGKVGSFGMQPQASEGFGPALPALFPLVCSHTLQPSSMSLTVQLSGRLWTACNVLANYPESHPTTTQSCTGGNSSRACCLNQARAIWCSASVRRRRLGGSPTAPASGKLFLGWGGGEEAEPGRGREGQDHGGRD